MKVDRKREIKGEGREVIPEQLLNGYPKLDEREGRIGRREGEGEETSGAFVRSCSITAHI